jgi:ABC-2 type transport system ATP-binding protein
MPILECNQLSKSYGKVPALDGVSFAIEPGRIVGLLGPNGSGKTTLIKLANGLLTPSSGEILIDGRTPGRETHAMVSYLPERTAIPTWMSAGQLMDFYEDFYPDFRRQAAEEMLHHLNIQPKQRIKQMSKGTREKVQLIMVMSRAARLYLLDEPIGGVDPATPPLFPIIIPTPPWSFPPTSLPTWKRYWMRWCSSTGGIWCCSPPWIRFGRKRA